MVMILLVMATSLLAVGWYHLRWRLARVGRGVGTVTPLVLLLLAYMPTVVWCIALSNDTPIWVLALIEFGPLLIAMKLYDRRRKPQNRVRVESESEPCGRTDLALLGEVHSENSDSGIHPMSEQEKGPARRERSEAPSDQPTPADSSDAHSRRAVEDGV